MEMGNQYGVNMGNILSTASNIKTARLNREVKQRELDRDKAKERNVFAKIQKGQKGYEEEADETGTEKSDNALLTKKSSIVIKEEAEDSDLVITSADDEDEDTDTDTRTIEEVKPKLDKPVNIMSANKNIFGQDMIMPQLSEEEMRDYALDSDSYDKMVAKVETSKLVQRQYEQKLATLQMTMPDITPAQRQELAKASVADLKTFSDMIVKADDKTRKIIKETQEQQARQLFSVTQLPKEGSARQDAYTQWRNTQIQLVPKDKQQKVMDSIPEWSNNTMNWIGQKLATVKDTFDTVNEIEAKKKEAQAKVKAETIKHMRQKDEVFTEGEEDVTITPTKKGWKEKNRTTSSNVMVQREKNKSGSGGSKTSDFSLVEKIAIRNTTGLDLDNPDDMAKFAELSQEQRDTYTDLSARASRIYKDGGGKITHAEAVKKAAKEKSRGKTPVEGKLYKKNGATYKIVGGKPVKQ